MNKGGRQWSEDYDVVIVGSGFSGLAAAIEARLAGSSVVVLEKMNIPGGNSAISGGLLAVAGSPLQERAGISDTADLMFADMLQAGLNINHPQLARLVAEQSLDTLLWTLSLGAKYKDNLNHLGGHSVPRTYNTMCGNGLGILQPLLHRCRELSIPIRLKTKFRNFIVNSKKRVCGIEAVQDAVFNNDEVGNRVQIRARKGVVLACGGFGSDIAFRTTQDPRLTETVEATNHRGATAEGLIAALEIGAIPIHLSWIQMGPWASADEKGWGVGSMFTMLAGFPYGIMVDAKNGKRFVNEMSDRRLRTDAMLSNSRAPVAIVDCLGVKYATTLEQCLKRDVVKQFDTIEELAAANTIPVDELKETLARYRLSLEYGRDIEFGKVLSKDLRPIEHPPFYSIRLVPKVHHCMGGIQINQHAQVLALPTYRPLPGLYAAGEVTGGIHGASRLGSNAIVDCLVFGRIAGKNVAQM